MLPLPFQLQAGAARQGLGDPLAAPAGMVQRAEATGTVAAQVQRDLDRHRAQTDQQDVAQALISGVHRPAFSRIRVSYSGWLTRSAQTRQPSSSAGSTG